MLQAIYVSLLTLTLTLSACSRSGTEDLLREAAEQREARNYHAAIVLLKSALEKEPENGRVRYALADTYLQAEKFDIAEKEFGRITGDFPEQPLKLAQLYIRTGRPQAAIAQAHPYLTAHDDSVEARHLLAQAHLLAGEPEKAEEFYRQGLQRSPADGTLAVGLADLLLRSGKIEAAQAILLPLVQREPGNAAAHRQLGRLENLRGNRNAALEHYRRASELAPGDAAALYTTGLLLLQKGELDEAEVLGRRLRERFPEQSGGDQLLGFAQCLRGNFGEAAALLQKVTDPDLLASYLLGMSYYKLGQLEQAVNQFQRVLDRRPDAATARLILGVILLRQERIDDAIDAIRKVLENDAGNALAHSTLGSAYLQKGLYDQAMAQFDRALELDPKLLEAHYRKGLFNESRGELAAAEADLIAALALAPEIPDLRLLLARNYLRQNRHAEAARTLQEGLTGDAGDAVLYNFLAAAHFAARKNDDGVACLRKAKELQPDYLTPYYNLAAFYALHRQYEQSRQEYEAILARKPDEYRALLFLALNAELVGEEAQAENWYRRAQQSGEPAGFLALADYLQRTGKTEAAIAVLDELTAREPENAAVCEAKGKILLASGRLAAARETFSRLDRLVPGRGSVFLAEIYLREGDIAKAGATARRLIEAFPRTPAGYLARAAVLEKEGKGAEAIASLREAAALLPDPLPLRMRLAEMYEKRGENRAALDVYQTVLREDGRYYPALYAIGTVHEKMGDKERASEFYRQALLHNPDFVPALNNLAYVYADSASRHEEALEMALRAWRSQPENAAILDTLGYIFYRSGRHEDAARVLEKAAVMLPYQATVHYHLALAYERLGRNDDALHALRRALGRGAFPEREAAGRLLDKIAAVKTTGKL